MGDTRPVAVELMRTLDEKFIANAIAFEAARPAAGFIADGAALRRADGSLDRELIRQIIAGGSRRMPAMRQRLMRAPLGLTTPGWVPVDHLDLDFHVRFLDDVIDDADLAEVLAGRQNGEMRLDHPLWDFLVGESASGDVVVVGRVHHAFGDGIFGMRVFDALVADEPYDPGPVDESRPPIRGAANGAGTAGRGGPHVVGRTGRAHGGVAGVLAQAVPQTALALGRADAASDPEPGDHASGPGAAAPAAVAQRLRRVRPQPRASARTRPRRLRDQPHRRGRPRGGRGPHGRDGRSRAARADLATRRFRRRRAQPRAHGAREPCGRHGTRRRRSARARRHRACRGVGRDGHRRRRVVGLRVVPAWPRSRAVLRSVDA